MMLCVSVDFVWTVRQVFGEVLKDDGLCVSTDFVWAVRQVFGEALSDDVVCVCPQTLCEQWGRCLGKFLKMMDCVCPWTLCERWGRCLGKDSAMMMCVCVHRLCVSGEAGVWGSTVMIYVSTDFVWTVRQVFGERLSNDDVCVCRQTLCEWWGRCFGKRWVVMLCVCSQTLCKRWGRCLGKNSMMLCVCPQTLREQWGRRFGEELHDVMCVSTDFVRVVRQVFGKNSVVVLCVCPQTLCERWGRCLGKSCRPGATASAVRHSCPQTPRPVSLLHRWAASVWRGTEQDTSLAPSIRMERKNSQRFFIKLRQWTLPFCAQQSALMMSWTSPECVAEMRMQWVLKSGE